MATKGKQLPHERLKGETVCNGSLHIANDFILINHRL